VYHDKNRYQTKDLSQFRYNIYSQSLAGGMLNAEPVIKLQPQNPELGAVWENVTILI